VVYEPGDIIMKHGTESATKFHVIWEGDVRATGLLPDPPPGEKLAKGGGGLTVSQLIKDTYNYGDGIVAGPTPDSACLRKGHFFGVSKICPLTLTAGTRVVCLCLQPELLTKTVLDKKKAPKTVKKESYGNKLSVIDNQIGVLGEGAFGLVKIVKHNDTDASSEMKNSMYYAVKCFARQDVPDILDMVEQERDVMIELGRNNFIVQLHATLSDHNYLYMLLDLVCGGDLYHWQQRQLNWLFDKLSAGEEQILNIEEHEQHCRFYNACIVFALSHLHEKDIVFRDLKPENLMVDSTGYLKLADFGFAKKMTKLKTWTMCGTPDYLAPEIITCSGHGKGADWWTLGVCVYEMLYFRTPFHGTDPFVTYKGILEGQLQYVSFLETLAEAIEKEKEEAAQETGGTPKKGSKFFSKRGSSKEKEKTLLGIEFSDESTDFVESLLKKKPADRLIGNGNINELKHHAWFLKNQFDWAGMKVRTSGCFGRKYSASRDISVENIQSGVAIIQSVGIFQYKVFSQ
jgi:serine/threonine protein kinase